MYSVSEEIKYHNVLGRWDCMECNYLAIIYSLSYKI